MSTSEKLFPLTTFSKGSGCGCKIAPATLQEIIREEHLFPPHPQLIVGNGNNDDAAVLRWSDSEYLISTTDFFTPIVDDAYTFGKIAAANALSDVYAMGGEPSLALAILGWPIEKLPASLANQVVEGARSICRMAGIPLAGGHSVDTAEPLFGLAVTGRVKENHLKKNSGAQPGDLLYLTKPIGFGIVTAASKRGLAQPEDVETAIRYMCQLNKIGTSLGAISGVNALTDVTGFGLLGHLVELCKASSVSAEIWEENIPLLPGLQVYIDQMIYPDMTMKNYAAFVSAVASLSMQQALVLCDPQTSGGLLISVSPDAKQEVEEAIQLHSALLHTKAIGRIQALGTHTVDIQKTSSL
jgi:selenide,water dikinase